jgi:hypothetical protein
MSLAIAVVQPAAGSGELRRLAASILSERRFRAAPLAQPFRPELHKVGHWLSDVFSFGGHAPGGIGIFWLVLAAVVLVVAVRGARLSLTRLAPADRARGGRGGAAASGDEDPRELERAADTAESGGAFAEAIRLRFRAGLVALGARGAIEYRSSLRTAEVSRRLGSVDFDVLAATFERIVYGGASAGASDAAAAREGWRRVLARAPK